MLDPITGGGVILLALVLSGALGECLRRRAAEAVHSWRWNKYAEKMAAAKENGDDLLYLKYSRKFEKAYQKWQEYL